MTDSRIDNPSPASKKVDKGLAALLFPMLFLVYAAASVSAAP